MHQPDQKTTEMPKPDEELDKALAAIKPTSKAARLRPYLPTIIQKIEAGITISDIVDTLNANGLDITAATLKSYLYRYRKKHKEVKAQPRETLKPPQITTSVDSLERIMNPDSEQEAQDLARYERLGKLAKRSQN